jgi:hypothetical protein
LGTVPLRRFRRLFAFLNRVRRFESFRGRRHANRRESKAGPPDRHQTATPRPRRPHGRAREDAGPPPLEKRGSRHDGGRGFGGLSLTPSSASNAGSNRQPIGICVIGSIVRCLDSPDDVCLWVIPNQTVGIRDPWSPTVTHGRAAHTPGTYKIGRRTVAVLVQLVGISRQSAPPGGLIRTVAESVVVDSDTRLWKALDFIHCPHCGVAAYVRARRRNRRRYKCNEARRGCWTRGQSGSCRRWIDWGDGAAGR